MHVAITPDVHDDLAAIFARGMIDGVDFMTRSKCPFPRGKGRNPAPRISLSAVVRHGLRVAAEQARGVTASGVTALPERTGTVDADRLRAARGTMSTQACAEAAGLADGASVRNVENKGAPLRGRLLTWVEGVEAGR